MSDISTQLLDQVNAAINDKTPLQIQGNNTKANLGRTTPQDNVLSLSDHKGIVQYEPVELIMTVRAGTSLQEIDDTLAENNQVLVSDPRRYGGIATIAGSLASNQSGNARPWLGSLRDHTLGIRLINGKGEHLQFGGQVMKNVAGYDVSRLQAGAMGTLGVITEVSFKVLPKPDASVSLTTTLDAEEAIATMNRLASGTKPITASAWENGTLTIRLEGSQKAVLATVEQWQKEEKMTVLDAAQADNFWIQLREHALDFHNNDLPLWRFSVKPTAEHFLKDHPWAFNWTGAQRWLKGDFDPQELIAFAQQAGGEVQCYEGGDRQADIAFIPNDALKMLHQNVKTSLDPHGIFNPQRLYSWL